jgi:hypothetical protein
MDPATTLTYKVVELLRKINQEKGTNFQVLFTSYYLEVWLDLPRNILRQKEIIFLKVTMYHTLFIPTQYFLTSQVAKNVVKIDRKT